MHWTILLSMIRQWWIHTMTMIQMQQFLMMVVLVSSKIRMLLTISDFVVPDDADCITDPPRGSRRWADYESAAGDEDDEWEGFLQRAVQRSELDRHSTNIQSTVSGDLSGAWRLLAENSMLEPFELQPFVESAPDRCWPLYYVQCRVSLFIKIDTK
jgi:hypothetical protein